MQPKSIQKLIELFVKFPTVGPRTAARFVSHLLQLPKEKTEELMLAIKNLKEQIKFCSFCFNPFEPSTGSGQGGNLCEICSSPNRDKSLLCIIEKETDLAALENTKRYKGLYFIFGGTLSTLKKSDIEKLRINELKERIKSPEKFGIQTTEFKEIIIATNPTIDGEATADLIEKTIKSVNLPNLPKITRLGRGLPVGGELEYADEETLKNALEGRKPEIK